MTRLICYIKNRDSGEHHFVIDGMIKLHMTRDRAPSKEKVIGQFWYDNGQIFQEVDQEKYKNHMEQGWRRL